MNNEKGIAAKATPTAGKGVTQKKGGTAGEVHTPPTKRKNALVELTTEDPKAANRCKKTQDKPNSVASKPWVSSIINDKHEPILEGAKAIRDPTIYKKLLQAMILPLEYDVAINMRRKDHQHNLNCAHYHVSLISLV